MGNERRYVNKRRDGKARKHSTDVRKERRTERNGTEKGRIKEGQEKKNCMAS